MDKIHTVNFRP